MTATHTYTVPSNFSATYSCAEVFTSQPTEPLQATTHFTKKIASDAPYTIQAQGFIDVGASIKGHKVTKRCNLGDTGELDANENLSFSFENHFGS